MQVPIVDGSSGANKLRAIATVAFGRLQKSHFVIQKA
jgi:hypothetical protein